MATLLPHPLSGIFTDARARILDVLLAATGPESGRTVAAQARVSPTTANQALDALFEAGLVRVTPHGRAMHWTLAEDHELVRMLRSWTNKADAQARDIVEEILGEAPAALVVFGSAARGDDRSGGDIDLLLVAEDSVRRRRYREKSAAVSRRLRLLLGRKIEVIVMDIDELRRHSVTSFVANVTRDGRTLAGTPISELVA